MYRVFFATIAGALLIVVFFVWHHNLLWSAPVVEYVVVLTQNGYEPKVLTITPGSVVRFVSNRGEPFWPASDSHPAHAQYPDFDPQKSIAADKSWSFTFPYEGTYDYHDHLNSTLRGTIYVSK
jgi:plastocyanin